MYCAQRKLSNFCPSHPQLAEGGGGGGGGSECVGVEEVAHATQRGIHTSFMWRNGHEFVSVQSHHGSVFIHPKT